MKFLSRPSSSRIHILDSWKKSAYSFTPNQTNFGDLCAFADDIVLGGQGFGMHPHKNIEITTILIEGAQAHKDSTGGHGILNVNSVQTMSAGTGIMHSEFNASGTEPFHSYQIWVYPKLLDIIPRHEKFEYQTSDKLNKILLVLSPDKRNGSAFINQDAFFSVIKLEQGKSIQYNINLKGNGVYIHSVKGNINIESYDLKDDDALGVYDSDAVNIYAITDSEIIFVEVPMTKGINI